MMTEKSAPQVSVALGSRGPVCAGFAGAFRGPMLVDADHVALADRDSHARYLSGRLLAIRIRFLSTIEQIGISGRRFRFHASIVFVGPTGRLVSLVTVGKPSTATAFALVAAA
jgi:Domain of unknown function (DUF4345)